MELLIAVLLVALFGVVAQAAGYRLSRRRHAVHAHLVVDPSPSRDPDAPGTPGGVSASVGVPRPRGRSSMPPVDRRRSSGAGTRPQDPGMDILLVIMLIAVLGLFAQAVGADTRGFDRGRAA